MDVSQKLDEIVSAVGAARSMPMSASCVVNRQQLLAMLEDPSVVNIVRHCGGDVAKLRLELEQYLTDQVEVMPDEAESGPEQTISFQRVLQRALMHAQGAERDVVTDLLQS